MAMITDAYNLSLSQDDNLMLKVRCSQGDTSRDIQFTLYHNGEEFTIPSGVSAAVTGVKSNGAIFKKNCTISSNKVVLAIDNTINDVAGVSIAEVVLSKTNGERLGTSNFSIFVEADPLLKGKIETSEISPIEYITQFIDELLHLNARVDNIIAPEGEATLSEVVDARLSSLSGTTYASLKARIDADVASLHDYSSLTQVSIDNLEEVLFSKVLIEKGDYYRFRRKRTSNGTDADDIDGTRLRIVYKIDAPCIFKIQSPWESGVAVSLYTTLDGALEGHSNSSRGFIESYTNNTYTKKAVVNRISSANVPCYLSISLKFSNGATVFTDNTQAEAYAALNLYIISFSENVIAEIEAEIEAVNNDINTIEENLDATTKDVTKLLTESTKHKLYVGDFVQLRSKAEGFYPSSDELTLYRVSSKNTVAFPRKIRKLYGHIKEDYVFSILSGVTATNLNHAVYWYDGDFEISIPDGDNYYRISLANAAGGSRHDENTITPNEDFGLEVYFEENDTGVGNEEAEKILNAARLTSYTDSSNGNSLVDYAVIAHTSDCHGDYQRVENFLNFCDKVGVDVACVTGDIASYMPEFGFSWFHDIVKSHKTLPSICVGNHDVSGGASGAYTDADIYTLLFEDIASELGNETEKTWYYKDIPTKNIRIISINLYQYGGTSRWYTHFTAEQITFIINTLSSTPEGYGVLILSHSPQVRIDGAVDFEYPEFFQMEHVPTNMHNAVSGGVPLYDIVDAFISRTTLSKTYTQTGSPDSITVDADFTSVDGSVEFIAHLTGHAHADQICYLPDTANKQLMLNIICTASLYGGASYPYLSDVSDVGRNSMDSTQDAFNVYVIDRANKLVKVVRIGSNLTYNMSERKYMEIPYAD